MSYLSADTSICVDDGQGGCVAEDKECVGVVCPKDKWCSHGKCVGSISEAIGNALTPAVYVVVGLGVLFLVLGKYHR